MSKNRARFFRALDRAQTYLIPKFERSESAGNRIKVPPGYHPPKLFVREEELAELTNRRPLRDNTICVIDGRD